MFDYCVQLLIIKDGEQTHSMGSPMDRTRLPLIRQSRLVFRLWGSPVHRTPHDVIPLTILHDHISI